MADNTAKKQRGKPFKRGRSGNPDGRPFGALNRATMAAQALLDGEAEALTRKAVELALEGNMAALKLCLERICPPRRERPLEANLPSVAEVNDLPRLTGALIQAVGRGELTTGEAAALSQLATAHGKTLELADLERRLKCLEEAKK